jgi:hypothetical protein
MVLRQQRLLSRIAMNSGISCEFTASYGQLVLLNWDVAFQAWDARQSCKSIHHTDPTITFLLTTRASDAESNDVDGTANGGQCVWRSIGGRRSGTS